MAQFEFLPDPSLWQLKEAYRKLCSTGETGKPYLTLIDDTLFVLCGTKTLAEFQLYFDKYPVDSNLIMSQSIMPTENFTLFDNNLTALADSDSLEEDRQYVRAFVLMIKYPDVNDAGTEVDFLDKNASISLFMRDGTENILPLYNFFSSFTNPVTLTQTEIIDKVVVSNPNSNYSISINALILKVKALIQENDPKC